MDASLEAMRGMLGDAVNWVTAGGCCRSLNHVAKWSWLSTCLWPTTQRLSVARRQHEQPAGRHRLIALGPMAAIEVSKPEYQVAASTSGDARHAGAKRLK